MLLAIDVGNTNTVFAIFNQKKKLAEWRCATEQKRTADEYFVWLKALMELSTFSITAVNSLVVSSVVPQVLFNLRVLSNRYFNCRPMVVGKEECRLPIDVRVEKGAHVGADRLVNTAGAYNRYGGNLIVVDFGTATTLDVVDNDGAYIGGTISPGVNTSMRALHQSAAALPYVDITKPKNVIGTDTISCIQSGVFWGYIGLIEGMVKKISEELERKMKTIATGGLADLFAQETNLFEYVDHDITLHGLAVIHAYNKSFVEKKKE